MAKHGNLQQRIIKNISPFFPCKDIDIGNPEMEFSIRLQPFTANFCTIAIEKFKKVDSIRVVCILYTTPKIQETLKKLTDTEMRDTMEQFNKLYHRQYKTDYLFAKDYTSIQNMKHLFIQNLSLQSVLDSIYSNIVLAREVVQYLIIMDKSMESAEIDPNNPMFQ